MKWGRISIIVLLISFIAILSALNLRNNSIFSIIQHEIPDAWQGETAVYMIYQVDTCCRPVIHLQEILAKKKIILFLFHPDFSDEDIENFRNAFKIPPEAIAKRMNESWQKVFYKLQENKMNRNKPFLNYFIDISKGKINTVEAF